MRRMKGGYENACSPVKTAAVTSRLAAAQTRLAAHQFRRLLCAWDLQVASETQVRPAGCIGPQNLFSHLASGAAVLAEATHHCPHLRSGAFQTLSDDSAPLVQHEDVCTGEAVRRSRGDFR